jgi:hypothetical protein
MIVGFDHMVEQTDERLAILRSCERMTTLLFQKIRRFTTVFRERPENSGCSSSLFGDLVNAFHGNGRTSKVANQPGNE